MLAQHRAAKHIKRGFLITIIIIAHVQTNVNRLYDFYTCALNHFMIQCIKMVLMSFLF